jgi:hypothetical protein
MRRTIITALAALAIPQAPVWADKIPACANEAAQEFGAPEKVFRALAAGYGWSQDETIRQRAEDRGEYGPMGLGEHALPVIAQQIDSTVEALKTDPCENYRGAAWWLMNPAGGSEDEIWEAVNRYFYGDVQLYSYPMTERVRAIYENL